MLRPELAVVQAMGERPVYRLDDLLKVTGSRATAYRTLGELRRTGFAEPLRKGYFTVRSSFFQPYHLWEHLVPSLNALKLVRYFGRSYNENDIKVARQTLSGSITLDYRAYELTGFQAPYSLFLYVDDLDSAASSLRHNKFWEGSRGRVAILPRTGSIQNELQRVYLDCIAYGGRSTLDAIAIEILHGGDLDSKMRGVFRSEDVLKVREELATSKSRTRSG